MARKTTHLPSTNTHRTTQRRTHARHNLYAQYILRLKPSMRNTFHASSPSYNYSPRSQQRLLAAPLNKPNIVRVPPIYVTKCSFILLTSVCVTHVHAGHIWLQFSFPRPIHAVQRIHINRSIRRPPPSLGTQASYRNKHVHHTASRKPTVVAQMQNFAVPLQQNAKYIKGPRCNQENSSYTEKAWNTRHPTPTQRKTVCN